MREFIYKLSFVVSIVLSVFACYYAYLDRGYMAVGGEFGVLLIPFIVMGIDEMLRND